MSATPSGWDLLETAGNETVHGEHVAALAMRLFDRTATRCQFPESDRRLLWTAALYHDVAFRDHPAKHARVGARLFLKAKLPEVTTTTYYYYYLLLFLPLNPPPLARFRRQLSHQALK